METLDSLCADIRHEPLVADEGFKVAVGWRFIHVMDDEEYFVLKWIASNRKVNISIPFRNNINIAILLMKRGLFDSKPEGVYVEAYVKEATHMKKIFLPIEVQ